MVRLSDFRVPVVLHNGTVTCEVSTMSVVASGGRTVFSGCTGGVGTSINDSNPFGPPVVTVDGSALTSLGAGGGTIHVSNSTIDTFNGRVRGGDVTIGLAGPVSWDDTGTLTVAPTTPNPLPVTFLLSGGSTIETKATVMTADDVAIQGASTWRSFDPMRMFSTKTDVRSASIVDARSDLGVGRLHDHRERCRRGLAHRRRREALDLSRRHADDRGRWLSSTLPERSPSSRRGR